MVICRLTVFEQYLRIPSPDLQAAGSSNTGPDTGFEAL